MTSIKVDVVLRDSLAGLAKETYGGVTLNEALKRIIREKEENLVLEQYARLQQNPEEWADYLAEVHQFERVGVARLASEEDEDW